MHRRRVLAGFFIAMASGGLGSAARGATKRDVRRVGFLSAASKPTPEENRKQWAPLGELGWIDGETMIVERCFADGRLDLLPQLAQELIAHKVELILTVGTEAGIAAKNATSTIPIVLYDAGDPVGTGLVASLARPAGNVTGYSLMFPETEAKVAALVRELLPGAQRVGVTTEPRNRIFAIRRKDLQAAYESLGIQPVFIEAGTLEQLEQRLAEVKGQPLHALVVFPFAPNARPDAVIGAALRYRLPTIASTENLFQAGAVLAYEINTEDQPRRIAFIVDRILRGAKPAELPVEQPTRFTLMVNQKAARALGLTVPRSLLLRADELIQ